MSENESMSSQEMRDWLNRKLAEADKSDDDLIAWYHAMTPEQLLERMRIQEDETLRYIVNDVALIREAYEVCQAAKKVLEERGQKL